MSKAIWKKGSATLTATLVDGVIEITPPIGKTFKVTKADWLIRAVQLQEEGWTREEDDSSGLRALTGEPPKIPLHGDTVLRRRGGAVYLMTSKERGWDAYAHRVPSEAWVAVKFQVRLGAWSRDEHGEYCPVTRVFHRMVSQPPRPNQKTG